MDARARARYVRTDPHDLLAGSLRARLLPLTDRELPLLRSSRPAPADALHSGHTTRRMTTIRCWPCRTPRLQKALSATVLFAWTRSGPSGRCWMWTIKARARAGRSEQVCLSTALRQALGKITVSRHATTSSYAPFYPPLSPLPQLTDRPRLSQHTECLERVRSNLLCFLCVF